MRQIILLGLIFLILPLVSAVTLSPQLVTSSSHRLNLTGGSIKGFSTVNFIGLNTTIWGNLG